MLLSSTTGLVILALVLIGGWFLGLASSSGGKTWKARYLAERDAHQANRKIADDRVAEAERRQQELERDHAAYRTSSDERIAVAERARADERMVPAGPLRGNERIVTTEPQRTGDTVVIRPQASREARSAYPTGERRGWFDWGR